MKQRGKRKGRPRAAHWELSAQLQAVLAPELDRMVLEGTLVAGVDAHGKRTYQITDSGRERHAELLAKRDAYRASLD